MKTYYANNNAQQNGDHEVHTSDCSYLPKSENRIYLGLFASCHDAVKEAEKYYSNADGCKYCCPDCHKS